MKFFSDGKKEGQTLVVNARKNVGILNNSNEEFLNYLTTTLGNDPLTRNKMKIHIENGQIFDDNNITGESLYDFLRAQEDVTKKLPKVNIAITDEFDSYVKKVLEGITDDTNDMNANSSSKFLFYHFNMLRQQQRKSFYNIRHSIIADDDYALEKLQDKNWQYFVVTLVGIYGPF